MNSYAGNVTSPGFTNQLQNNASSQIASAIPGVQSWGSVGQGLAPYASTAFDTQFNNPYQGQSMAGAQGAAGMGQAAAGNIFDIGGTLAGSTLGGTLPYAGQIAQTAFDPQQQLYNRTLQQVQDQTGATLAGQGVANTPYGAGVEAQALGNFNIDWQNQQLQRQATGASALSQLYGTAIQGGQAGGGLMAQAPGLAYSSSQLPYQTQQGFGQNDFQSIMSMLGYAGGGQGLQQTGVQDWINALNSGTSMQGTANSVFGNSLNQANMGWNQLAGLGSGLGSLASMFI